MNSQLPERYGGAGASYLDGVLIAEELAWGCAAIATTLGINELAATPVLLGGSEEIKAKYLGMLSRGAQAGLLLPDRAGGRLGRVGHAHHRRAQGRQVRHQRLEGASSATAATPTGTRSMPRPTRTPATAASPPSWSPATTRSPSTSTRTRWAARLEHGGDQLQRDRGSGRATARRGEPRLQAGDDDAGPKPPRRRRNGNRHRPRRLRVRHRVLQAAGPVRCADRHAPSDPVHDRRHGDRDRGRPPARVASRRCCSTRASATRSHPRTPSASLRTRR